MEQCEEVYQACADSAFRTLGIEGIESANKTGNDVTTLHVASITDAPTLKLVVDNTERERGPHAK